MASSAVSTVTPWMIVAAAVTAALAHMLPVVLVDGGRGLGEPMWRGFALQVMLQSLFCLSALALVSPLILLTARRSLPVTLEVGLCSALAAAAIVLALRYLGGVSWLWTVLPAAAGGAASALIQLRGRSEPEMSR